MGMLKLADFYYGAFLSALLNAGGVKPSLFDNAETDSRRIYKFATNKTDKEDHIVYTKYVNGNNKNGFTHWIFNFSEDEVSKLKELSEISKNVKIALVCAMKDLKNCEIALIDYRQALDCLGVNIGVRTRRINIKAIKGRHGLMAFGSGRADKKNGEENYITIARDSLSNL